MSKINSNAAQTNENPYRVGGGYWASVEALRTLGVEKFHSFDVIIPAVRKAMGAGFKDFKAKEARNENGKDADGRIITNVSVVARKDYGAALREQGMEVRFNGREKTAGLFKAVKVASKPQGAVKTVKATKAVPKAAKPPKGNKAARKPSGAKASKAK